eukprot:g71718.t1
MSSRVPPLMCEGKVEPTKEQKKQWESFDHSGKAAFDRSRAEWIKGGKGRFLEPGEGETPLDIPYGAEDPLKDIQMDKMITHLQHYTRFSKPIPLSTVVDLLNVLWEEDVF